MEDSVYNPFNEYEIDDDKDKRLAKQAVGGDREALEELIRRHQNWIYNIACRMVWHPQEAEDVTQEVLIKVITKLSTFEHRSKFRTWLYRIVTNHLINMKKRKSESYFGSFNAYAKSIDETPDRELPDVTGLQADLPLILEEIQIGCMTGMLLCLNREQRLAFILGAIFNISDRVGGEIMGINRDNYRQRLCRARKKIAEFMNTTCGLMNQDNRCHCIRKSASLIEEGVVDPKKLIYANTQLKTVKEAMLDRAERLDSFIETKCRDLFRSHPFQDSPDFVSSFRQLISSEQFQNIIGTQM